MKLSNYLKDKIFVIVLVILTYWIITSFMIGFKIIAEFRWCFTVIYFLLFIILFLYDYFRKYFFYKEILSKLDLLDEKYLICELISKPNFLDGEILYQILYETNKSMNENIRDYRNKINDFKEYVELWIHEVKIPLSALILYTHNKKTSKDFLKEINKIDKYLEQIIYYIRSENTEVDYIIKEVDLNKVIRDVMLKNKDVLLERNIDIISDIHNLKVLTDYKWLEFMANQVISNSMKYMRDIDEKKIEIKAYKQNKHIVLEILDNGMGIPTSDIGRVLNKTFTGQNGRKVPGSTGMGLYIVSNFKISYFINIFLAFVYNINRKGDFMEEILKIDKIEKYYGNKSNLTKAIDDISFTVNKGEFVAIMGASGSGKTTLLNCISTIDKVTSGHIYVAGDDITKLKGNELNRFRREELGFIFQDFNLLDTLTGYENIALALSIQNVPVKLIDKKIEDMASRLNIKHVLKKYPYQMSGGEKQRVASARAIITNPKLVLADEPTGALDSKSSRMLLESFNYLNTELKTTILMVTHDAFSASYASRVIFIKDGKIFNELVKAEKSRKEFFDEIIDVVTLLGGDLNDAL